MAAAAPLLSSCIDGASPVAPLSASKGWPLGIATVCANPSPPFELAAAAETATEVLSPNYIYYRSFFAVFMKLRKPPALGAALRAVKDSTMVLIFFVSFYSSAALCSADCLLSSSALS